MYSPLKLASKYLGYWLRASNGKGHGIHSPFVFDFVVNVLNDNKEYYCYAQIEGLRRQLLSDKTVLTIEDFGAGSRTGATKQRSIRSIAHNALKPKKYGQLLFRLVNYYQCSQVIELGTSLGVTSAYLASASAGAKLVTMEGAPQIAAKAKQNFEKLALENIELVTGNFDETLAGALAKIKPVDLAFIDGNHRRDPTLRYFAQVLPACHENSILVFDDIHWSEEMEQAWEIIKADEKVLLTIDLFFIGLVFFRKDFIVKQHFTIRY